MINIDFKKFFGRIAKNYGFEFIFGGWVKDTCECIVVLELMKSNFGNYYELNIKTFVQGAFGRRYLKSKELVKTDMGNILQRPPVEYKKSLDLDSEMTESDRVQKLESMFVDFLVPFTDKLLTRTGISELAKENKLRLLPPIKKELGL